MLRVEVQLPSDVVISGKLRDVVNNFLRSQRRKIKAHTREIVKRVVYDVYRPVKYVRTYALSRSVDVVIKDDPLIADIIFNPDLAPAKTVPGGYQKFVAGEGPGIGFLREKYPSGPGFPRAFHHGVVTLPSRFYSPNLAEGLKEALIQQLQEAATSNPSDGG